MEKKIKYVTRCIFAFSGCFHCFPRKSSAFPSSHCLRDSFLFFFQNKSIVFLSLTVSFIFSFRQNVELFLSTSGYEAPVLRSSTRYKRMKFCCRNPRDVQPGNCFRKRYRNSIVFCVGIYFMVISWCQLLYSSSKC